MKTKINTFIKTIYKTNFLITAKNWFLKFLQIQLVMSLVSLVILINWGIPISLLSPIGNMVFTPIFTVFLGLSSIIFFLEILHIPNGILIYLLEKLTSLWFLLAQSFNNKSLIGFVKPPILFTIIVPILILFILTYKQVNNSLVNSLNKSIIALAILFFASCTYLKIAYTPQSFVKNIACNKGYVTFIYDNGKTAIIDPGYIGQRISAPSWIQYTLIPNIIKSSGATTIDHLIILQPGKITFDAIKQLSKSIIIKNIDLITFDLNMKKNMEKSFNGLITEAKERNIKINRIGKTEEIINLTNKTKILITPIRIAINTIEKKPAIIKNNKITYPAICLTCDTKTIDNKIYKIYSAKYLPMLKLGKANTNK